MKQLFLMIILSLFLILLLPGCSGGITGTVIDVETGKPIEGAIVLVEWTMTKGIGLTHTDSYKVVEKVTDKNGKFSVSGVSNPFVDPPMIVVYKDGYIAWRNDYIFPGFKKRTDFIYKNGVILKLEKFKKEYSHKEHLYFIEHGIMALYELPVTELPKFRKGIVIEKAFEQQNAPNVKEGK